MATIKLTLRAELTESDGHTFIVEESLPNVATGDNPIFLARDVETGAEILSNRAAKAFADRFGDVRRRGAPSDFLSSG